MKKLLSLGAVFGMLGGIYYWFEKITGVNYPETLGKIHFWIFFLGANLTFFPMHFLGIAGMPRRIPDYPDAFSDFNQIASYGSYISAFSAIFFFYIVFVSFSNKKKNISVLEEDVNDIWFNAKLREPYDDEEFTYTYTYTYDYKWPDHYFK